MGIDVDCELELAREAMVEVLREVLAEVEGPLPS
jgi:hypothetical protein